MTILIIIARVYDLFINFIFFIINLMLKIIGFTIRINIGTGHIIINNNNNNNNNNNHQRSIKRIYHKVNGLLRCSVNNCNKIYKTLEGLDAHYNCHEGIYPYICSVCNLKFPSKGEIYQHKKRYFHD